MGIKHISGNFDSWLDFKVREIRKKLLKSMCYIGEICMKYARNNGNYLDRTGNLRSSIGYVILDDGKTIIGGGFEPTKGKKGGSVGQQAGSVFLKNVIKKYSKGIVLIVVAGMEYASYVEDMENYDVITSSKLLAKREVPKMLRQLKLTA